MLSTIGLCRFSAYVDFVDTMAFDVATCHSTPLLVGDSQAAMHNLSISFVNCKDRQLDPYAH